jgi:hypothetical protein
MCGLVLEVDKSSYVENHVIVAIWIGRVEQSKSVADRWRYGPGVNTSVMRM